MLDDIAQNCDILFAIFRYTVLLPCAPPFHRLQSITALGSAERVFRELVELYPMPKRLEEPLVDVEGPLLKLMEGGVRAEDFQVEAVPVEGDDVREFLELTDELFRVFLEPSAEALVFIPSHGDSNPEPANVGPSAFDLVRKAKRLNIQIYLAIK